LLWSRGRREYPAAEAEALAGQNEWRTIVFIDESGLSERPQRLPHLGTAGAAATAARSSLGSIGRYRIIRLLGEGGMGSVYEAEQDQPRRRVALKVIRSAWASSELIRRFELEFQTLGRLHHPGIAQIYEAGSADNAFGPQPFLPWR
jgi:serine/threonine protein kinase